MIIPDANLLLYAYDSRSDLQPAASQWLAGAFSGADTVGLPWISIGAFLRISTNHRIGSAIPMAKAVQIVEEWLARRSVRIIVPGERHWSLLKEVLVAGRIQGANTTDAQLAALTMEHGGVLYTADSDFARFPGLRWKNPLQMKSN